MPFVKVWIHLVWATKNRYPYFDKNLKDQICKHIYDNAKQKNIFVEQINGHNDHLHCLISIGIEQNIAKIAQLLKGESSFWINQNKLTKETFEWQDDYFAVSVSESMVAVVKEYIKNQEIHHLSKTFAEEYNEFISKYKFD